MRTSPFKVLRSFADVCLLKLGKPRPVGDLPKLDGSRRAEADAAIMAWKEDYLFEADMPATRALFEEQCRAAKADPTNELYCDIMRELRNDLWLLVGLLVEHYHHPLSADAYDLLSLVLRRPKEFQNRLGTERSTVLWHTLMADVSRREPWETAPILGALLSDAVWLFGDSPLLSYPYFHGNSHTRVLDHLLIIDDPIARSRSLRTYLSTPERCSAVTEKFWLKNITWLDQEGPYPTFRNNRGQTYQLVDIEKDTFVLYSEAEGLVLHQVRERRLIPKTGGDYIGQKVFQVDGTVYLRAPIAGYPEILLGYRVSDHLDLENLYNISQATGDMDAFDLFTHSDGDVRPLAADHIKLNIADKKTTNEVPRVKQFELLGHEAAKPPRGKTEELNRELQEYSYIRYRLRVTTDGGEQFVFTVTEPDWSKDQNRQALAKNTKGVEPILARELLKTLLGAPIQCLLQQSHVTESSGWSLLPAVHGRATANASGQMYSALSVRGSTDILESVIHENMGHHTHYGGEAVLFPLMILLAKKTGLKAEQADTFSGITAQTSSLRPYAGEDLPEFWAVAQETYHGHPHVLAAHQPMRHLLAAVITPDGSRFEPSQIQSAADLGIKIVVEQPEKPKRSLFSNRTAA